MKKLFIIGLLLPGIAFAQSEPINANANTGVVKNTSSGVGSFIKPFDFNKVSVTRLPHSVTFFVDGQGTALTDGTKNPIKIPYGGTLKGWLLVVKPSGSVTVDIFRAANTAGLPVTSIIGGSGVKPSVSSAVENASASFTDWTSTTLTEKDNLAIDVSGVTGVTYLSLTLYFQ